MGGLRDGLSSISDHKIVAGEEGENFTRELIRCLLLFTDKGLLHNLQSNLDQYIDKSKKKNEWGKRV